MNSKAFTTALAAATAVVALSACTSSVGGSSSATTATAADTSVNVAGTTSQPDVTVSQTEAPAAPQYTTAQQEAIDSAQSYLEMSGFSRAGLIEQLSSKAGEGFRKADAVFAVNHIKVDWNREAVEAASSYLDTGG